jgi:hypothetical protein
MFRMSQPISPRLPAIALCLALGATSCVSNRVAAGEKPTDGTQTRLSKGLTVSVKVAGGEKAKLVVGQRVEIEVEVKNSGSKPVSVWAPGDARVAGFVRWRLLYLDPFGEKTSDYMLPSAGGGKVSAVSQSDVVSLAPGKTWKRTCALTPKLAGRARLTVSVRNRADKVYSRVNGAAETSVVEMPNAWTGRADFSFPVRVENPKRNVQADLFRDRIRVLNDRKLPLAERTRALEFSREQRTSLAVGFLIRRTSLLAKDSPFRPFAVRQLAEMAAAGYGCESVDLLTGIAADPKELPNVRGLLKDLLEKVSKARHLYFSVDHNEGVYVIPDSLQKRAAAALKAKAKKPEDVPKAAPGGK